MPLENHTVRETPISYNSEELARMLERLRTGWDLRVNDMPTYRTLNWYDIAPRHKVERKPKVKTCR